MSVELYPDHKAILHFHQSLTVFEVDLLSYLSNFLLQDQFAHRDFNIYVKPTLFNSALDFIIVEPRQRVYIIQAPRDSKQFNLKKQSLEYFLEHKIANMSPALNQKLKHNNGSSKIKDLLKSAYYIYDQKFFKNISENVDNEYPLIQPDDFYNQSSLLQKFFAEVTDVKYQLSIKEANEIKYSLNPYSNIQNYVSKTMPKVYEKKAISQSQTKQKFKGAEDAGKSTLLAHRIISCATRLKNNGEILVVSGDITKVTELKDLITAEDGRSLQELGITVASYQELMHPQRKYRALFIDDAQYLKANWFHDLLENYLVEMNEENDYEYVVMANEDYLPKVAKIPGPFSTIDTQFREMDTILSESREIFLQILKG